MSNYINSLNAQYNKMYSYTRMNSAHSKFNNAPIMYGKTPAQNSNYVNSNGINYLTKIQESTSTLSSALQGITNSSAFSRVSAVSSNTNALTVNASSAPTNRFQATSVSVSQVATGQANRGESLQASDIYTGGLGTQRFEIEVDGKTTQFEIDVKAGDTNRQVQERMASAINAANIGVTASVSNTNNTSALSIQSLQTGEHNAKASFTISDRAGSTVVAALGASKVSQVAQDAVYTINGGVQQRSASNNINLGEGVSVTLRQATTEPVNVSIGVDTSVGVTRMQDLVKGFNELLSAARSNTNGNNRLQNDLLNTAKAYASTLNGFGITMGNDGRLSIDSTKLEAAAKDGSLERYFTSQDNANYGLANRLSNITNNVNRNPGNYINKFQEDRKINFADPSGSDLEQLANSRNFNLARYNSYQNTYSMIGMLFNIYV